MGVTKIQIAKFLGSESLLSKEVNKRILEQKNDSLIKTTFAVLTLWAIVAPFILWQINLPITGHGSFAAFFFKAGGWLSIPWGLSFIAFCIHRLCDNTNDDLNEGDIRGILNREIEQPISNELRSKLHLASAQFLPKDNVNVRPTKKDIARMEMRVFFGH